MTMLVGSRRGTRASLLEMGSEGLGGLADRVVQEYRDA